MPKFENLNGGEMKIFTKNQSRNFGLRFFFVSIALILTFRSYSSFAVESNAVFSGKMIWVLSSDLERQYPNGELTPARVQYLERIEITSPAELNGRFRMSITVPKVLTGGQVVVASYDQIEEASNSIKFVSKADQSDFVECIFPSISWLELDCPNFTIKSVSQVPSQDREAHIERKFKESNLALGLNLLSGEASIAAEPIGSFAALDSSNDQLGLFNGSWNSEISVFGSEPVAGNMELEGFYGIFVPKNSNFEGPFGGIVTLTNVFAIDGGVEAEWQTSSSRGWVKFSFGGPASMTGMWGLEFEAEPKGFWIAER